MHFLFFGSKLGNIETEISRKKFNRAQNPGVEKKLWTRTFRSVQVWIKSDLLTLKNKRFNLFQILK
jgi:hypothetical protein